MCYFSNHVPASLLHNPTHYTWSIRSAVR